MDWIDPKYQTGAFDIPDLATGGARKGARKSKRPSGSLSNQVAAALAQPLNVWAEAFDHSTAQLKWPKGVTAESTFLFSTTQRQQAEVLVRAGMSAKKLAGIVSNAALEKQDQVTEIVGLMDQSLESAALRWLDEAGEYAHAALGVAAVAWHIPEHASRPGNEWLPQWLQATLDRVIKYKPDLEEAVLCHLVLQCEMPLLIGVATSASKRVAVAEASRAMDNLAEYLERGADDPGPWLVHGGAFLRASLASVVRSRVLANSLGLRKWYPPQQAALVSLLEHAARWSRPDGTTMLGARRVAAKSPAVWQALRDQSKRPKQLQVANALTGIGETTRKNALAKAKPHKLPALTNHSEDASNAIMRSDWRHKGGQVAIDYSEHAIRLEALGPKGKGVLSGDWTVEVHLDGQSQMQLSDWEQICWFSDADADYIELEAQFGESARVQRQAVLFRDSRLLLLSETLHGGHAGDWKILSRIPMAAETDVESPSKMTELLINTESARCLALPLFLPEWRGQSTSDSFECEDRCLIASVSTGGKQRAYAPVLVSLCGSHADDKYTWRRLTVGEDLRLVGHDEAVAYRVQHGDDQKVLYRTLAPPTRRTALGMHTMADFYAGSFDAESGEPSTLVEVEPSGK